MAEGGGLLNLEQFSCSICQDLLKDPVAIPCGHSYCMGCIKGCWDQDDHTGVYSCPQCKETFTPRPVLNKNTLLAEVVETLKKTGLQAAPPAHCYAGPGDVECDVCTKRKLKAIKSCLVCLASYCETHLQPHYESAAFKKHKLIKATGNLQICSVHDELLEVYCRTDQQCICLLCGMDEHKNHNTVPAAVERTSQQEEIRATQIEFQQRIQEREKGLQDLRQAVQSVKRSAWAAVEDIERMFNDMFRYMSRKRFQVKRLINEQKITELIRIEGLLERLEQEIAELRRRDAELEQLSHTEDNIHFLQSCQSLCDPPGPGDLPSILASPHVSFEAVTKSVSELKALLQNDLKVEPVKNSESVSSAQDLRTVQPRIREDFLQYSRELTLDRDTAHRNLSLTKQDSVVTGVKRHQLYRDSPKRFDCWIQVLCREALTGRCYWEAEWSWGDGVDMAVTYINIYRKGVRNSSGLGYNDKSWSLECSPTGYYFWHDDEVTEIRIPPSSRIGVYLDHGAGTLSFYSVSDTMTLLHRVQTAFTQPLYAAFGLRRGSSVRLCYLSGERGTMSYDLRERKTLQRERNVSVKSRKHNTFFR